MATIREVTYFNSFIVKKLVEANTNFAYGAGIAVWPGLPWNPDGYPIFPNRVSTDIYPSGDDDIYMWYIEESRIRGGYNNDQVDLGVRAYIKETTDDELILSNGIIYSGLYNSTTGFNDTNVFSVAEKIQTQVDPRYGGIQKLYASNTNLVIFQNDKVSRALIDKDEIYTADGNALKTASSLVIGSITQYAGEYGISNNPESFTFKGNRIYFSDKNRGAIMRLSTDGLTEISMYGMRDYFRDKLSVVSEQPEFSSLLTLKLYAANPGLSSIFPTNSIIAEDSSTGLVSNLELGMQFSSSIYGNSGVYVYGKQNVGGLSGLLTITNNVPALNGGPHSYTLTEGSGGFTTSRGSSGQTSATIVVVVDGAGSVVSITATVPGTAYSAGDVISISTDNIGTISVPPGDPSQTGFLTITILESNLTNISTTSKRLIFDRTLTLPSGVTPANEDFSFYKLINDKIVGGYDNYYDNYVVSIQDGATSAYDTLSFSDSVNGWTSLWDYNPSFMDTINNVYYSIEGGNVWKHYNESVINNRGYFYGTYYPTSVQLSFNSIASISKNFNTINYEGTNGWQVDYFLSDRTGPTVINAETNNYKDETSSIYSYDEGVYTEGGVIRRVGFNRKENKYVANLINKGVLISGTNQNVSFGQPGQVVPGSSMSGIKGFFATVKLRTDNTTELGGLKTLFTVSSNFVKS
tara:strand:+ start:626 stop:2701 length:2076 start_codon:yes stop_codon:yes gene_type:complete